MEVRSPEVQVTVHAPITDAAKAILTPDALRFVGFLCLKFESRRRSLLAKRVTKALEYDAGETPHFASSQDSVVPGTNEKPSTASADPHWRCAKIPPDVIDRRVEITGPVDRKMVINGLNSGANVYMADLEDSTSPTWNNVTEGQLNLKDACAGTIAYTNPKTGKVYALKATTSVLMVRPRGWHLDEGHVTVNGRVASASLFDFGLYLYHNVNRLMDKGTGPYFYLPKLEGYLEARLWNDVFVAAQQYLGVPTGTIRATVLLEVITAAFEMEEILYELREHSLGLNCGRWDYLFSYIKKFKLHQDKIAPDRSLLTMTTPLMEAYVKKLIYVCHKRGTFAMGGMSASIPVKNNSKENTAAMDKVTNDKLREVVAGHDGTWVAHPALVSVARSVFDKHMPTPNQIDINPGHAGARIVESDLLKLPRVPHGQAITSGGLKRGVDIILAYSEAWLRGIGCIPLHNAMEDAATAEISRVQIWQWINHRASTQNDRQEITSSRIVSLVQKEVNRQIELNPKGKWRLAGKLVENMLTKAELDDFLTTVCYPHIMTTVYETMSSL